MRSTVISFPPTLRAAALALLAASCLPAALLAAAGPPAGVALLRLRQRHRRSRMCPSTNKPRC